MTSKKTAGELAQMTSKQLDELPFGVIELAADGTILSYNESESKLSGRQPESVIGRNFFTEVAPCTDVREFHGRFLDLIGHRAVNHEFEFTFSFAVPVKVFITMLYEQHENTVWVMVNRK